MTPPESLCVCVCVYVCEEWNISALIPNPSWLLTLAKLKDSGDACLYVPVPLSHIHPQTWVHRHKNIYLHIYRNAHSHSTVYEPPPSSRSHRSKSMGFLCFWTRWWREWEKERKREIPSEDSVKGSCGEQISHVSERKEGKHSSHSPLFSLSLAFADGK